MMQSTRNWLPAYCDPNSFLPAVQETIVLFDKPPYLFQDFVGKAYAFLQSDSAHQMGLDYDPRTALPCKWKCSDESVFGVDLCLYAYTGQYPFDKGLIGGRFNDGSLGAAVHHGTTNVDFGGSHVGYVPGQGGGSWGHIARPFREQESSTDCGYLMSVLAPFKETYDDACKNIVLFCPEGSRVCVSIPNEFLQPSWSSHQIKLIVDIERLTRDVVTYDVKRPFTHKIAGRSLFYVSDEFFHQLTPDVSARFRTPTKTPIGPELTADYFNIFDTNAELENGVPRHRFLPYVKFILSSKLAPFPLKAAVTNANIEYNRLTDSVRAPELRPYSFASFTGVFIDLYSPEISAYVNLFQPIGITIKPPNRSREIEIPAAEIHQLFSQLKPVSPKLPLGGVLGYDYPAHVLEKFTYQPVHSA